MLSEIGWFILKLCLENYFFNYLLLEAGFLASNFILVFISGLTKYLNQPEIRNYPIRCYPNGPKNIWLTPKTIWLSQKSLAHTYKTLTHTKKNLTHVPTKAYYLHYPRTHVDTPTMLFSRLVDIKLYRLFSP